MSDILEEILIDQSDEKKVHFVRKLLKLAFVATIFIIAAMIFYNIYQRKNIQHNQEMSDIFLKAIDESADHDSVYDLTIRSLDKIPAITQGHIAELALIEKARILAKRNDIEGAKTTLEQILQSPRLNDISAAYARLAWLGLIIDEKDIAQEDLRKASEYFNYFSRDNVPFYGIANIIRAIWQVRNNQAELAAQNLSKLLTSVNTPKTVREQAKALLSNIENNKGL